MPHLSPYFPPWCGHCLSVASALALQHPPLCPSWTSHFLLSTRMPLSELGARPSSQRCFDQLVDPSIKTQPEGDLLSYASQVSLWHLTPLLALSHHKEHDPPPSLSQLDSGGKQRGEAGRASRPHDEFPNETSALNLSGNEVSSTHFWFCFKCPILVGTGV